MLKEMVSTINFEIAKLLLKVDQMFDAEPFAMELFQESMPSFHHYLNNTQENDTGTYTYYI